MPLRRVGSSILPAPIFPYQGQPINRSSLTLAGLSLAIAASTHAATITRNVNVTLNAANTDSYALDVNNDGLNDFTFTAAYVPDPAFTVGFDTIDIRFGTGNGTIIDAVTGDGFPASTRLALGTSVGPTNRFSSVNDQSDLYFNDTFDPATGNFNGQTGYVGLRFDTTAGTLYGFAQVTVKAFDAATNNLDLTIGTVGYNTVVGQAVTIVPEPITATASLGAIGVLAFRRRRSAGR